MVHLASRVSYGLCLIDFYLWCTMLCTVQLHTAFVMYFFCFCYSVILFSFGIIRSENEYIMQSLVIFSLVKIKQGFGAVLDDKGSNFFVSLQLR